MAGLRLGTVTAYEEDRGLGRLQGDEGEELAFHCTAISDKSRRIEVGQRVAFLTGPAHGGRYEASEVAKLP